MKHLLVLLSFSALMFGAATPEHKIQLLADDNSVIGVFDAHQKDMFTGATFSEIAATNREKGLETLVARVQTNAGVHMYDAFALNRALFGCSKPQTSVHASIDPESMQAIKDVRYFLLHSPEDRAASTVGSMAGLARCPLRKEFLEMIFFANNAKVPEEQRILASIAIGTSYALAQGVRYNDAQKALYWYEKGLLSADERLRAKANYHIGLLYESDCGVEGHLQIARSYFKKAIDQNASVGSKELALFHVARLDEREGKILAALAIYRRLVDEATIPAVREDAQQKLKEIEQRYGHASVYGLEEKRTDPSVYGSPRPGRASAPDEGLYQLQRDQKLQAFLTNPDGSTSSYEPLEDQNTPPRSNDSSSFSDSV